MNRAERRAMKKGPNRYRPAVELDFMSMILHDFEWMDEIERLNLIRALLEDLPEPDLEAVLFEAERW